MLRDYSKLYERKRSFQDYFAKDLTDEKVWYNSGEFARYHNIDGYKLLCVIAKNTTTNSMVDKTTPNKYALGVNDAEGVLFCRAQDISRVKADQVITIDGKEYLVKNARLLQEQVWRIELARVQE